MVRYKLLAPAQIDGTVYVEGSIIERPDDWRGPHRVGVAHSEVAEGAVASGHDVPLYERLPDEHAAAAEPVPTAEEIVQAKEILRRAEAPGIVG